MKKTNRLLLGAAAMAAVAFGSLATHADDAEYNFQRAMEALANENYDEAMKYASAVIADAPDHPYGWMLVSRVCSSTNHPGAALSTADKAMTLLSPKDKELRAQIFCQKADVLTSLNDSSAEALQFYNRAVELCPRDTDYLQSRAEWYYNNKRYDESDADFKRMLSLSPGSWYARMGMARNAIETKRYAAAIPLVDAVLATDSAYYQAYAFRAEARIGLKQWREAAADVAKALTDGNNDALTQLRRIIDSVPQMATPVMEAYADTAATPDRYLQLGWANQQLMRYADALNFYLKADSVESSAMSCSNVARMCDHLGMTDEAVRWDEKSIAADSTAYVQLWYLADSYTDSGKFDSALTTLNRYISLVPDDGDGYFSRGRIYEMRRQYADALDDYDFAVALADASSNVHFYRARVLDALGRKAEARKEYGRTVATDTAVMSLTPLALHALGDTARARAVADSLATDATLSCYSKLLVACYYAASGHADAALQQLEAATAKGYVPAAVVTRNGYFDGLSQLPRYKQIMADHAQRQQDLAQRFAKRLHITSTENSKNQ